MPEVKSTSQSHSPVTVNEQGGGAANVQHTSALSAAHPNATVTQAHTPPRVDPPPTATIEEVKETLSGLVGGHGGDLQEKARRILSFLPEEDRTPDRLGALDRTLKNNEDEIKALLNLTPADTETATGRHWVRGKILRELHLSGDLDEAKGVRKLALVQENVLQALVGMVRKADRQHVEKKVLGFNNELPDDVYFDADKMETLLTQLQNHRRRTKRLLQFLPDSFGNTENRNQVRATLLADLANGKSIAETEARRALLLKRDEVIHQLARCVDQGAYDCPEDRALQILGRLPSEFKHSIEGLNRVERCLEDNGDGVRRLLKGTAAQGGNSAQPAKVSAFLLDHLLKGAALETIMPVKDLIADDPTHPIFRITGDLEMMKSPGQQRLGSENALKLARAIAEKVRTHDQLERVAWACESQKRTMERALAKLNQKQLEKGLLDAERTLSNQANSIVRMAQALPRPLNTVTLVGRTDPGASGMMIGGNTSPDLMASGTWEKPKAFDVRSSDGRSIIHSNVYGIISRGEPIGVAGIGIDNATICNNPVVTTRIHNTQALVLLGERDQGRPFAILAHLRPEEVAHSSDGFNRRIDSHKENDPSFKIHSLNWIEVEPAGANATELEQSNADCKRAFKMLAANQNIPLNIIPRPHHSVLAINDEAEIGTPPLSVIVDPHTSEITMVPVSIHDNPARFEDGNFPLPRDQQELHKWIKEGLMVVNDDARQQETSEDPSGAHVRPSPNQILEEENSLRNDVDLEPEQSVRLSLPSGLFDDEEALPGFDTDVEPETANAIGPSQNLMMDLEDLLANDPESELEESVIVHSSSDRSNNGDPPSTNVDRGPEPVAQNNPSQDETDTDESL